MPLQIDVPLHPDDFLILLRKIERVIQYLLQFTNLLCPNFQKLRLGIERPDAIIFTGFNRPIKKKKLSNKTKVKLHYGISIALFII